MKKIVSCLLSLCIMAGLVTTSFAASPPTESTPNMRIRSQTTVTDPAQLAKIAIEDGLDIPEGYHLESVTTSVYEAGSQLEEESTYAVPFATYTVSDVKTKGDFYYPDVYDSDWYDGPCTVSHTYETSETAEFSSEVGVSGSVVSGKVGFTIGQTYKASKTFTATVAANKQLNVRVHTNYQVKSFNVYSGSTVVGSGEAWKPVGLIFKQYTYSM